MNILTLARSYLPTKTIGVLFNESIELATLERSWADNKKNKSCIPEGVYVVKRDKTGRHQWYSVQDVTDRTFIELHGAHKFTELLGCIGIGLGFDDRFNLNGSDVALNKLLECLGDDDSILHIRAANKDDF